VEILEAALKTIALSMANCEFYASIFHGVLNGRMMSPEASKTWGKQFETAISEFYASVIIFSIKAKRYFRSSVSRMLHSSLL
jgi:hypothetical protein